jgi:hypothetical protein
VSNALVNPNAYLAQGGNTSGCLEIPFNPPALVITLTIAEPDGIGNARAWPSDVAEPLASNINYRTGINIANTTTVTTCFSCSTNFKIKVTAPAHLIVDVNGYFRPKDKTIDLRLLEATWANATPTTTPNRGYSIAPGSNGGFYTSVFLPDDYSIDTVPVAVFMISASNTTGLLSWSPGEPLRDVYGGSDPGEPLTIPTVLDSVPAGVNPNVTFFAAVPISLTSAAMWPGDLLTFGWGRGAGDTNPGNLVVYGGYLVYE